jgi:signal transduction histidine kinase
LKKSNHITLLKYFCLCIFFSTILSAQVTRNTTLDSIISLRKLSNDDKLTLDEKLKYAIKSYELSKTIHIDSTRLKSLRNLAFVYLISEKYDSYRDYSHKALNLAIKLNDTTELAFSNHYLGYYHHYKLDLDSAYYYYYNAQKLFGDLNDAKNKASILQNMALIQRNEKDYVGSEKNAIEAIRLVESLPESTGKYGTLWSLYNNLALVSEFLGRREEAVMYHNKTIEISKKTDNPRYDYLSSINNLAYTLEGLGQLKEAYDLYDEVASDKQLFEVDTDLYVIAIGNVARLKFMIDETKDVEAKNILFNTLKITDSLDDTINEMGIYGFLADIYNKTNKKDSALFFSKKLLEYAKLTNSNTERLQALKLLGQLEDDNKGIEYLNEHIRLSDSLIKNERTARDKFARIEFETDQIIAEKEQISKERLIFLLSSIGILIGAILIYIIISQRAKNKQLRFNQMQQEANEEIYNLMIAQQDKIEEGRAVEKKRISKELHDGILGKLFGTRLNLDTLNLLATPEAIKSRERYISGLKSIEEEIRKISHDLSNDFVSESNFVDIITALIETQTQAYKLKYTFENDPSINWEEFPNKTKIHIYRMLQETLQNIYKHANANEVKISFKLKNNVILMSIEDDGEGFNVNKARKGIGLKNIDSRVREIGGIAKVFSEINKGTKFEISIPTTNQ